MNKLCDTKRAAILRCLIEGSSIRSTARIVGVAKGTVLKLLVDVGEFCAFYQDRVLRDLPCTRLEVDEVWAFVGAKRKNATRPGDGDVWTHTCLDPESKLMVSWMVGDRSTEAATEFMCDVASRMAGRIQLSTDGHNAYEVAVRAAWGWKVDWAQVVKSYSNPVAPEDQRRYSPASCTGVKKVRKIGNPDPDLVSTSLVERSNLHLRMSVRRFTRLTNAFSKKIENHAHAVALAFFAYNFITPHGTLTKENGGIKTTPAMAVGLTGRPWRVEDILAKMDPDQLLQVK